MPADVAPPSGRSAADHVVDSSHGLHGDSTRDLRRDPRQRGHMSLAPRYGPLEWTGTLKPKRGASMDWSPTRDRLAAVQGSFAAPGEIPRRSLCLTSREDLTGSWQSHRARGVAQSLGHLLARRDFGPRARRPRSHPLQGLDHDQDRVTTGLVMRRHRYPWARRDASWFDQARSDGVARDLDAVVHVEFLEKVRAVPVDRLEADA